VRKRVFILGAVALAGVLGFFFPGGDGPAEAEDWWLADYDLALKQAAESKLPILVGFR